MLGGAVAFALLAVLLFPSVVRWRVGRAAAGAGATVEIGKVRPIWFGARLEDVLVRLDGVDHLQARFGSVRAGWGLGGTWAELADGDVTAFGDEATLVAEIKAWRAHRPARGSGPSEREISVAPVRIHWGDAGRTIEASGVVVERGAAGTLVRAEKLKAVVVGAEVDAAGLEVALLPGDSGVRVQRAIASELHAKVSTEAFEHPLGAPKPGAGGSAISPNAAHEAATPRRRLDALVARALAPFVDEPFVRIERADAVVSHGGESVRLGPGLLELTRIGGALSLAWSAGGDPADKETPEKVSALGFKLKVPAKTTEPIVLELDGGPIALSAVGVREGELGVVRPERAKLQVRAKLEVEEHRARFDGEVAVKHLSLRHDALSDETVEDLDVGTRAKLVLDWAEHTLDVSEAELRLGGAALRVAGKARSWRDPAGVLQGSLQGTFEVPLVGCQTLLDGLPKGLARATAGVRMAGSFALKGKARIDTTRLEFGKHDKDFLLDWDTTSSCRVTEAPPAIHVSRFKQAFSRTVWTPEGKPVLLEAGPKTQGWVARGSQSPFLDAAVTTTEDGGFRRHAGFDKEAIRNSIRENIRTRKFSRGASTISMQLAKNLYLDRKKNLSRKLQEAILTAYLEQELTKEQILELYLNIVELGPMIYGVGQASNHYFHTSASQLSVTQAFYLATLLPNPRATHVGAGGAVAPGWSGHIRTLLKIAAKTKRITEDELDEGLRETVIIGSPTPLRSPKAADAPEGNAFVPEEDTR